VRSHFRFKNEEDFEKEEVVAAALQTLAQRQQELQQVHGGVQGGGGDFGGRQRDRVFQEADDLDLSAVALIDTSGRSPGRYGRRYPTGYPGTGHPEAQMYNGYNPGGFNHPYGGAGQSGPPVIIVQPQQQRYDGGGQAGYQGQQDPFASPARQNQGHVFNGARGFSTPQRPAAPLRVQSLVPQQYYQQ
jgi:hypothetical protein